MNVSYLDDLGGAFTDGVQKRFLDTLEVDAIEQQLDGFHRLTVYGQVQGTATHVVDTVHVERDLVRLLEGLSDDWDVTQSRRVQVYPLFVRQL